MNNTTHPTPVPNPGSLHGKTAIVTGAGQGIGFAICRHLIAKGAKVILNDADPALANQAAATLNAIPFPDTIATGAPGSSPCRCIPLPGDAADIAFTRQLVDTCVQQFGRLDVLIANAGLTLFGDFFSYTPESFAKVMQLNLAGTFFLAQAAALQMRQQQQGGSLLFTSSVTGHQAHRHLAAYGMSKAALEMLARNLVIDLSPYGINVNTVAPGATLTERTALDPSYEKTWSTLTPMGRPASVDDIAAAVLFLVSPEARHITGQTLIVDGGWTAISPGPESV
ncbi:MAG: SDR family oxidoreductase [Bacteroidetes bacterium]|nr:SDR family oxidoreductase [Bacteroidota bacterium]